MSDWYLRQFALLINCILDSSIYLGYDAVMIARPSSYKFRFIYHFMIAHYEKKLFFDQK